MKTKLLPLGLALALVLLSGCTSVVKFPPSPTGAWGTEVKKLGPVLADSGRWPLSLSNAPTEYTYYSALRAQAAKIYAVPVDEVVLGEVTVKIGAELNGVVRDWKASAEAGQKKGGAVSAKSPADSLLELKKLYDAGAITLDEYEAKKKVLVDKL